MEICRRKMARMVLNGLLAGAASALICFAQKAPASHAAGKSAAHGSSAGHASAQVTPAQKVVLKVGDAKVTQAEVDALIGSLSPQIQRSVETQGRKPVGDEYAMMVLLSQKAQSEHMEASPEFQRRIAFEKLQLLAQEEYQKIATGIQVSPDEINTYYNAHKSEFPEEAEVRQFVVRKKAADAKAGDPGLSSAEAKTRLAAIQKAVEAGTDLKQVAKQFDVPNTVMVNSEPVTVRKGEMIPALDSAVFELKPNQFSDPVDTPQAVVLLQLLTRHQPEVKEVSGQIENELKQQKLRATMDDIKAKANIWMDPEYFKAAEAPAEPQGEPGEAPAAPSQP